MNINKIKPNVFATSEPIIEVSPDTIKMLIAEARQSPLKRARFCAHFDDQDPIQEMLIVLIRDTYICPHKHPGKSESFHVIDGQADVVIFEDDGTIARIIHLSDYHSGQPFYYRMARPCFHTLIVRSDFLIIHETTNGPFRSVDCQFAPWAPKENESTLWPDYLTTLKNNL